MLLDFFLPSPCLYCNKVGVVLCEPCLAKLHLQATLAEFYGLPLISFSEYRETAKLVNAIKENGLTSVIPKLARTMAANWPETLLPKLLVPVPSSPANKKIRGFSHTGLFARSLAREIPGAMVQELLLSSRNRKDQSTLSQTERRENLVAAFRVSPARKLDTPVWIFDDVLTSGATLTEAARTLVSGGLVVAGFCVFARVLGPGGQY